MARKYSSVVSCLAKCLLFQSLTSKRIIFNKSLPCLATAHSGLDIRGALPNVISKFLSSQPLHSVAEFSEKYWKSNSRTKEEEDVKESDRLYTIRIVTGGMREAGTLANIKLKLLGTTGDSSVFSLGDEKGFERGTVISVRVPVPIGIGRLRTLWVEKGRIPVTETKRGWFLEKILVEEPDGKIVNFPCMQWIGERESGNRARSCERYLLPSTFGLEEDVTPESQPVSIKVSGMVIPHPQKVVSGIRAENKNNRGLGGEDAYFFTPGINNILGMGVADGVYSWRKLGIDPGRFSKTIMDTAYNMIRFGCDDVYKASRKVESEGLHGSSTCCLLTINMQSGQLNSANIGDSGFVVIGRRSYRNESHIIFRTPTQEHEFGRPYQLGHHEHASKPEKAMLESFQIFPQDTIVMGTDGFFDNIFASDIVKEVVTFRQGSQGPQALVNRLVYLAHENSLDRKCDSPYARGYAEAFDLAMTGGKPDDITVLVAYIN